MEVAQEIRVILFQEHDRWVAQCLEYDIGAQAAEFGELCELLLLTFRLELETSVNKYGEPFKGIAPAPRYYHDLWEKRSGSFEPKCKTPITNHGARYNVEMALCA